MRDVKFRVWDKINKEWLIYKDCNVGWLMGMNAAGDPPKKNMMRMYASPDGSTFCSLQFCLDSDDFEVDQFTGLTIQDDIDIYENDIVNIRQYGNHKMTGVVRYFEPYARFEVSTGCASLDFAWIRHHKGSDPKFNAQTYVIGNTHENPGLA